jgi:hypothetical protein
MEATSRATRQKTLVGLSKFFFPSLVIDDTEYSRDTSTTSRGKKKTGLGLGVRQFSEASQEDFELGWAYGAVSMGDHRQASVLFVLYYRF